MSTKLIELRPDRELLNPNFNGYKLSLEKIPVYEERLQTSIERVLPNAEQYSLSHAKLFGLHNYLYHDKFNTDSTVYYIDGDWCVNKIIIDSQTGRLSEIRKIFKIPQNESQTSERYNLSLNFTSNNLVLISDGCGVLHIVETGNRNDEENWKLIYSEEILEDKKSFVIADAIYLNLDNKNEVHCLLNYLDRNEDERSYTFINWVTLTQTQDSNWGVVSLRVLKGVGQLHYCYLERNGKFIYVASDSQFKFILDSENPIIEKESKPDAEKLKVYSWLQTSDDITLRFNVNSTCSKHNIDVKCMPFHISVKHIDTVLLEGELWNRIDADLTTWTVSDGILEIIITKTESGLMWQEFVKNDESGEHILDPSIVNEVHQRLAHLCSETEVIPAETGPTFSSQQIEECDFNVEDTAVFERLCSSTHEVTHRINLGSLQILTTVTLSANYPPALILRHDVDGCVWQPIEQDGHWEMKHEGTLLAFGYVQASKEQRKFSVCSPTFNYSVVCELCRHAFIYRQSREVHSGELRNRRSGRRVDTVAEQQVISLGENEILGIYAHENYLYLLTENVLKVLQIKI